MRRIPFAFGLALLAGLRCVQAQDTHALHSCAHVADDAQRLSCYDAAMGVTKIKPAAAKPATAPSSESTVAQPDAGFGDDGRLHTRVEPALPKSLSAQVRAVAPLPAGRYRLTLDNGQVWETTQADSSLAFKTDDAIVISRGWLGSFQVSLAGHTTSVSAARKE